MRSAIRILAVLAVLCFIFALLCIPTATKYFSLKGTQGTWKVSLLDYKKTEIGTGKFNIVITSWNPAPVLAIPPISLDPRYVENVGSIKLNSKGLELFSSLGADKLTMAYADKSVAVTCEGYLENDKSMSFSSKFPGKAFLYAPIKMDSHEFSGQVYLFVNEVNQICTFEGR